MHLKRIEMVGFKSFADLTKLEFKDGITAVVGPNGCGKSNIADAVRWVLGEQSAKAVRGKVMEDVIFNGTEQRRQLGMAEVTLTLGDVEEALGIEFNEVAITRRIFRTGEGQYLVNRTPCRLKDIHDLFFDTGVGRSSYSIMAQGKIDQILSSRPEDRRAVFEEAAGITRYKTRRNEALRKLEVTHSNLLRLADLIQEVERRRNSLQRQAAKARRYRQLSDRRRGLEWAWALQRSRQLEAQEATLGQTVAATQAQVESAQQRVETSEEAVRAARAQLEKTEEELARMRQHHNELTAARQQADDLTRVNRERIIELAALTERHSVDIAGARAKIEELAVANAATAGEVTRLEQVLIENRTTLALRQRAVLYLRGLLESVRAALGRERSRLFDVERHLTAARNRAIEVESQCRAQQGRLERLAAEGQQLDEQQTEATRELESARTAQAAAVERHRAAQEELARCQQNLHEARARLQECQGNIASLRERLGQRQSQLAVYEQLEASFQGYEGGARALLRGELPTPVPHDGILGTLASRLDVQPGFDQAVESALGRALQAVLVRDSALAVDLLEALADQNLGRAVLYPLSATPPEGPAAAPATPLPGVRCALLDVVRAPANLEPLLRALLGQAYVVDSLARAVELSRAHPTRLFVTPDGELLSPLGVIEGGTRRAEADSLLARQAQILALRGECDQIQAGLAAAIAEQELRAAALAQAETDLDQAQQAQATATRQLADRDADLRSAQHVRDEIGRRLETVRWEQQRLQHELQEHQKLLADVVERRTQLAATADSTRARIQQREAEIARLQSTQETAQEAVTEQRVFTARAEEEVRSRRTQLAFTEQRMAELTRLSENRQSDLSSYHRRQTELEEEITAAQAEIARVADLLAAVDQQLAETGRGRTAIQATIQEQERAVHSARQQLQNDQAALRQAEIGLAETRVHRTGLVERVRDEYQLEITQIDPAALPDLGPAPDWDQIHAEVVQLREALDRIGPVNLLAIEEYEELVSRCDFLQTQYQDLVRSREQLMEVIHRINQTSQELFNSTFEQVRRNFVETFRELFGGGQADLSLAESDDPLESGIEIAVQPPSKRLQNITLLSGGERTLTAVALLFALYMVKPSPFCILDELDAPLDESNIDRFTKLLQKFTAQSQFIIITHNRRTIGMADALYGVTMEELGVSDVVSVRFRRNERGEAVLDEHEGLLEAGSQPGARAHAGPSASDLLSGRVRPEEAQPIDRFDAEIREADDRVRDVQARLAAVAPSPAPAGGNGGNGGNGKAAAPDPAEADADIATPVQDEPTLEPLDPHALAAAPAGVPDEA